MSDLDQQGLQLVLLILFLFMTFGYFVGLLLRNNGVIDSFYGVGFVLVALVSFLFSHRAVENILITLLILIWGLRLSAHITLRNWGKPEDFRYQNFRNSWKRFWYLRSYFQIYILQAVIILVISLPVLLVNLSIDRKDISIFVLLTGFLIWLTGFFFESVGDYQLMRFKSDSRNKGRLMMYGVWKYTRHPNYFGEATLWWGIFLIGLGFPYGLFGVSSPLLIDFLLLYVSGIPMLEAKYDDNPEYQQYKKQTNAFFPWFPKEK